MNEKYPATRDQNPWGTCWAHASIGLSEFYMINHGMADKTVDNSELHLVYWTYNNGTPSIAGDTGDSVSVQNQKVALESGGNLQQAAQTMFQRRGVAAESTASYEQVRDSNTGFSGLNPSTERMDVLYIRNAYFVDIGNHASEVKEAIRENGAVGVSICASDSFYNSSKNAFYCPVNYQTDHAIMLVGWDDDYPASNFKTNPDQNGAWLARNSWDTSSGASFFTYFWLSYADESMEGAWVYEFDDTDYENQYSYDSQIHNLSYFPVSGRTFYSANIFTVKGRGEASQELLKAISFEVPDTWAGGTAYTAYVYTDLTNSSNPASGTKNKVAEGTVYYPGEYTIELSSPVLLNKGEKYSVVIESENGGSVGMEYAISNWSFLNNSIGVQAGQSYYSYTLTSWKDCATDDYGDMGNVLISAYTDDMNGSEPVPKTISLTPASVKFTAKNETKQLSVTVTDTNGNSMSNPSLSFTSSNANVVTVSDTGLMKAVANGSATVTVKCGSISKSCAVTVAIPQVVGTVTVTPASKTFTEIGAKQQLTVTVKDTEGNTITAPVLSFSSSAPAVAAVNSSGLVTAKADGTATITVSCGEVSGSCSVTVAIPVVPKTISVDPASIAFDLIGDTQQIDVTVVDNKGNVMTDPELEFSSSDTSVATVSDTGLVTAVALGSTGITVCCGTLETTVDVLVDPLKTAKPVAQPGEGTVLHAGDSVSLCCATAGAEIYYTLDRSTPDQSSTKYSAPIPVTEDMIGTGLVINAYAYAEGREKSKLFYASYTVSDDSCLKLEPAELTIGSMEEECESITAVFYDARGEEKDMSGSYSWTVGDEELLSLKAGADGKDDTAVLTGLKNGSTTVGASLTVDGKTYTAEAAVALAMPQAQAPEASPLSGSVLSVGDTVILSAAPGAEILYDEGDGYKTYTEPITISENMLGQTLRIKAYAKEDGKLDSEEKSFIYTLTDEEQVPKRITLTPSLLELHPGETASLRATVYDADDYVITGAAVSFSSSAASVATVDADGKVTAVGLGESRIRAYIGEVQAFCNIKVRDPQGGEEKEHSPMDPVPEDMDKEEGTLYLVKGQSVELPVSGAWELTGGVVSVNKKGKLTARKEGTGSVSIHTEYFSYSYDVVVVKPELKLSSKNLLPGECATLRLDFSYGNEDYSDYYGAVFESSAPAVASVSPEEDGSATVIGWSKGSAKIRAYLNGKAYSCTVKVSDYKKVKLSAETERIELKPMQSVALKLKGYSFKKREWISDHEMSLKGKNYEDGIVRISKSGKLTAIGSGETTISVLDESGEIEWSLQVFVQETVERPLYMNKGSSKKLKIYGVKNSAAVWDTNEAPGLDVSSSGKVTAVKAGIYTLKCRYENFEYPITVYVDNWSLKTDAQLRAGKNQYSYSITLGEGDEYKIVLLNNGNEECFERVLFRSKKDAVVFADENGVLHARGQGSTTVSALVNGKKITIKVKVE
ncbi:MAG: Ig-like domain-containing protein [Lachnospiraceae bacterium]|nr:Ig-like domain-containing protein [Lachnospiraceae bacterium]